MAMKIGSGYLYLPPGIQLQKGTTEEKMKTMKADASKRKYSFGADIEDAIEITEIKSANI